MNIKDLPFAISSFALIGVLVAVSPVMKAAEGVTKLGDKAVDRFENGPRRKK
jgi:hypothetical protein